MGYHDFVAKGRVFEEPPPPPLDVFGSFPKQKSVAKIFGTFQIKKILCLKIQPQAATVQIALYSTF